MRSNLTSERRFGQCVYCSATCGSYWPNNGGGMQATDGKLFELWSPGCKKYLYKRMTNTDQAALCCS